MFPLQSSVLVFLATCQWIKLTFSINKENDILPKRLVKTPIHRKHLDHLIGQEVRWLIDGVMRRYHELFVQHQLFCQ